MSSEWQRIYVLCHFLYARYTKSAERLYEGWLRAYTVFFWKEAEILMLHLFLVLG